MTFMRKDNTEASMKIWRPWDEESTKSNPKHIDRLHPYRRYPVGIESRHPFQSYASTFKHPVRLYWTKAAYDYMYEAGERLLQNFPVQATIQVVEDSDSSDDEDEDDEDDDDYRDEEKEVKEKNQEIEETKKVEEKSSCNIIKD